MALIPDIDLTEHLWDDLELGTGPSCLTPVYVITSALVVE